MARGKTIGDGIIAMDEIAEKVLDESFATDLDGSARDFAESSSSLVFAFALAIVLIYLVLAAQFESYINPFVIMLTVPLVIAGGLLGLYLTDSTLNLYSQIGLVMLVGLAAKNGILIVEFANQLRDQHVSFYRAILKSAEVRLRPIVMTGITTAAGSLPLILSSGAGAETRMVIGIVILFGALAATVFTLFIVPVAYSLLSRKSSTPKKVGRILEKEQAASVSLMGDS
jgi:multidrug efflux pump